MKLTPAEVSRALETPVEPLLTPQQADVIRRLEAYEHPYFDLHHTQAYGRTDCFLCIAGALGSFSKEANHLMDLCRPVASRPWYEMMELIYTGYGRSVPVVRDYPASALPKHVGIAAVKRIFLMANELAGKP